MSVSNVCKVVRDTGCIFLTREFFFFKKKADQFLDILSLSYLARGRGCVYQYASYLYLP